MPRARACRTPVPLHMAYVLASFLDRLFDTFDEDPKAPPGRCTMAGYAASVARDLEGLLNTRRANDLGPEYGVLSYGLPDFSRYSTVSSADRTSIIEAIVAAIEAHEPRLSMLTVTLGTPLPGVASLQLQISATLRATPYTERVDFRATFLSSQLRFAVSRETTASV